MCKSLHPLCLRIPSILVMSMLICLASSTIGSIAIDNDKSMICSELCSCKERSLKVVMGEYGHKHAMLMGEEYREKRTDVVLSDKYLENFGPFGWSLSLLKTIVEIECKVNDGKPHSITDLLNGVHVSRYTALDIKCDNNEELIWDVGSWRTTVNIFVSENCRLKSYGDKTEGAIQLPMNLWIMEVHKGGANVIQNLDISFAMNMFAFIVAESSSDAVPENRWEGKYMISSSTISFHNDHLKEFACPFILNKHIDTINLGGNELTTVPDCLINSYVSITYLSLSHNLINDISALHQDEATEIDPTIEILDLSHNEIKYVKTLRTMSKLHTLDLSYNNIEEIGIDKFLNVPKLKTLFLQHNQIHRLVEFQSKHALQFIDFSNNRIERATLEMIRPSEVITAPLTVKFQANRFQLPPVFDCEETFLPTSGLKIYASGNKYGCGCKAIPFQKCTKFIESKDRYIADVFVDYDQMKCDYPLQHRGASFPRLSFMDTCVPDDDCPSGCDCRLEATVLTVNCSGRHLLEMPNYIPEYDAATMPFETTKLYLDHNPIQTLGHRNYLSRVTELYINDCLLSTVSSPAFAAMPHIERLHIHRNLLQKLPSMLQNISWDRAKNISMHSNRWACTCDQLWLPQWMSQHRGAIYAPDKVICRYHKIPVTAFSELEADCKQTNMVDAAIAAVLAVTTLASTISILVYYRSDINQLCFIKLGLRLWQPFDYGDAYSVYDAFLFYSQSNYKWVVDTLVNQLEEGPVKYRLCLHFRDFPKDEVAVNNIPLAIRLSRCSILVLSKDFFEREWNVPQLRSLFQRDLLSTNKMIIIVMADVIFDKLPEEFQAYMRKHEFLLAGEINFWEKLVYLLPPPRLGTDSESTNAGEMPDGGGDHFVKGGDWRADEASTLQEQGDLMTYSQDEALDERDEDALLAGKGLEAHALEAHAHAQ